MFGISLYSIIAFKGLIAIPEEVELQASFLKTISVAYEELWARKTVTGKGNGGAGQNENLK